MQLLEVELYFNDAGRFHTSAQDVLLSRHVVFSSNAAKAVEKTAMKQYITCITEAVMQTTAA